MTRGNLGVVIANATTTTATRPLPLALTCHAHPRSCASGAKGAATHAAAPVTTARASHRTPSPARPSGHEMHPDSTRLTGRSPTAHFCETGRGGWAVAGGACVLVQTNQERWCASG